MRPSPRALLLLPVLALLAGGCATYTSLGAEPRARIEKQFTASREPYFLRQSLYVTPFFGDASKQLLTAVPPEDVRLLNDLGGRPINPGKVEGVVPAGSRVRVQQVEFPTAFKVAERVLLSPRTDTWVYLDVEGWKGDRPLVLVLPEEVRTEAEFVANLERFLTREDLKPKLDALAPPVREAVKEKRAIPGMPEDALVMSWGPPARRNRSFREGLRVEEWVFPGGRRRAYLTEGRVTEVVDPGPQAQ